MLTACSIVIGVSAQFKKGTVMLGTTLGTTSYNSANANYSYDNGTSKTTTTHAYSLGVGPQAGIFLSNNLVLGTSVTFDLNHNTANSVLQETTGAGTGHATKNTYTFNVGPYLRYYLAPSGANNLFFLDVNGGVGTGSGKTSDKVVTPSETQNSTGDVKNIFNWNAGGGIGLTHLFTRNIGMDVTLGYKYNYAKSDNINDKSVLKTPSETTNTTTNNYHLFDKTNGVALGLGFHWFLFKS